MNIEAAGKTDVGKKREGNEDSFFIDNELRAFVVADGMGGHQAGEVASQMVVETVQEVLQEFKQNNGAPEELDETLSLDANRVLYSIKKANTNVYEKAQLDMGHHGMGSTVAGVFCLGETLIAANVGDSPIYLLRNGHIDYLSVTHTVEAELSSFSPQKSGSIDKRYHGMLTRAVGTEEDVNPDVCEVQIFDKDTLVICSDGLSNKVTPEEILDIATKHSAEEACHVLVGLANGRGGEDNITVIVVKIRKRNLDKFWLFKAVSSMLKR